MQRSAQNFAVVEAATGWAGARTVGLEQSQEGHLTLARIPAPAAETRVQFAGPFNPRLSGFAVSASGATVFALDEEQQLVLLQPDCAELRLQLSAQDCAGDAVTASSWLAVSNHRLYVADEAAPSVRVFTLPGLELSRMHERGWAAPRCVALDGSGRLYVLDARLHRILRLNPAGSLDRGYETGEVAALEGALDLFVAWDGAAFVSVEGAAELLRFGPSGASLGSSTPPLPGDAPGFYPGALAGDGERLYVSDRTSGAIWVYDCAGSRWLGRIPRFRAPVWGLATDAAGNLYVRTDARIGHVKLTARAAAVARGFLEAGPFDAGEATAWMRVHAEAALPADASLVLETALAAVATPPPTHWQPAPALDFLVHSPEPAGVPVDTAARFLWLRARFESEDSSSAPTLVRLVAETPGENYLARLPAVYARRDAEGDGFLRRLLECFRAELGDRELDIDELPRRFDPARAPEGGLAWLASWVAFELPARASVAEQRALLLDAHRLYRQRGTLAGLREMVRLHTGVECEIVESFRARHLWQLDGEARLGFDTGLLPCLPGGMVVPGPSLPDPAWQGLLTEYFRDADLRQPVAPPDQGDGRCEPRSSLPPSVEADGAFESFAAPLAAQGGGLEAFSVVWRGQIRPRFTELYTFLFRHSGGARVYVADELLIDTWGSPVAAERRGEVPLDAERWTPIRIEYWTPANVSVVKPRLSWSSPSQPQEIVPQARLYALPDDNVDPEAVRPGGGNDLIVGETVVGAHGPLTADAYGSPLFEDTAYRFTVRVSARAVCRPGVLDAIRAVLDAEKPAHTDYHLCVVEASFRLGTRARVGVDAVVAPPPPPGRYGDTQLGVDARLGISLAHEDHTLRVDETLRLGESAVLR